MTKCLECGFDNAQTDICSSCNAALPGGVTHLRETQFSQDVIDAMELGAALIHKAICDYDETGKLPDKVVKIGEYVRSRNALLKEIDKAKSGVPVNNRNK